MREVAVAGHVRGVPLGCLGEPALLTQWRDPARRALGVQQAERGARDFPAWARPGVAFADWHARAAPASVPSTTETTHAAAITASSR